MIVHALACDYDGTVAAEGRIGAPTAAGLERVRESGRKLVLVTGRMLPDLRTVCPEADRMFDVIVAENGAVLYFPERREVRTLGDAPEPALVEALRRRQVPVELGTSIVATLEPFAEPAVAAIRETGVERALVFNKGALMLLPGGVTKGSGLERALSALELSPHNVVAIGDGENDHALLALAECGVAVADAVPALRQRADHVTRAPNERGVVEFIDEHLMNDLAELAPRLSRHRLELGRRHDGATITLPAHRTNLLVVGPSASGKSTLTSVLIERLVDTGRSVFLLDPEGDYQTLAEMENVLVFGGKAEQALPGPDEVDQLARTPRTSVVLDLSAMTRTEKVHYGIKVLAAVTAAHTVAGLPHWLIIDEAHHILPGDGTPATELLGAGAAALCLITLTIEDLAPGVRALVNAVASTDLDAFEAGVRAARGGQAALEDGALATLGGPLELGEAALATLGPEGLRATRFRPHRPRFQRRRHVRKYTEGELPPDRSFYFRGPCDELNLRAANLVRFRELAEGVDLATWTHHLRRGDYSAWIREMIKDPDLARELEMVERAVDLGSEESRTRALGALRERYAV